MSRKILLVIGLLFTGVLLFGCTDLGGGGAAGGAGGGAGGAGERGGAGGAGAGEGGAEGGVSGAGGAAGGFTGTAAEVNGGLGETLSSGAAELTVHSYEFTTKIGYGSAALDSGFYSDEVGHKFVILNITLKNLRTEGINPYSLMTMYESSTDNRGSDCLSAAADVMRGGFSAGRMGPNEERTGLVACQVDVKDSLAIRFVFDTATVNVYKYSDVVDQLTVRGGVGEWVSSPHSAVAVRVDSCDFIANRDSTDLTVFRSASENFILSCASDNSEVVNGPGSYAACAILVVNVTMKNNQGVPWNADYNLERFHLKVGLPGKEVDRRYHERFFEVLDRPMSLTNLAPGEERQGQFIYAVGDGIPASSVPVVFYRKDPVSFGTVEVDCRQRGAPAAAPEEEVATPGEEVVQTATVQPRN